MKTCQHRNIGTFKITGKKSKHLGISSSPTTTFTASKCRKDRTLLVHPDPAWATRSHVGHQQPRDQKVILPGHQRECLAWRTHEGNAYYRTIGIPYDSILPTFCTGWEEWELLIQSLLLSKKTFDRANPRTTRLLGGFNPIEKYWWMWPCHVRPSLDRIVSTWCQPHLKLRPTRKKVHDQSCSPSNDEHP